MHVGIQSKKKHFKVVEQGSTVAAGHAEHEMPLVSVPIDV